MYSEILDENLKGCLMAREVTGLCTQCIPGDCFVWEWDKKLNSYGSWSYDLQRALVWNLVLVFSEHLEITYWPSGIAFSFCSCFFWHWFYVPICPDMKLNMNSLTLRFSQHTVWQLRQMQLQARSDGWQVWPLPAWIPFPHRGGMQVNVFRTRDWTWICAGKWEHFPRRDGQQASRLPWWCPWDLESTEC